jgi:DNA repair protein RecO (recombination protein O)
LVLAGELGQAAAARDPRDTLEPALRAFELVLLREAGHLPALDAQTLTLSPLVEGERYTLVPEGGLVRQAEGDARPGLEAARWLALAQALEQPAPYGPLLRVVAEVAGDLKLPLRALVQHHCGGGVLRTRQLMIDLQAF